MVEISTIEEALEDIRRGKPIIIVDDEDRENEGDFFVPAQICQPEHINFMARVGGGLVCVSMNPDRFEQLELDVPLKNTSRFGTPFGIPIDYREVTTGTSAHERALTARMVADESKGPSDFIRPGHLYTLKARRGGVLERAGHTEASVDLARLAGFYPAGVICEVMDEDGSMARLPKLKEIARRYDLKIVTIRDLIEYRLRRETIVERVEEREVETAYGRMRLHVFRDIYGRKHYALEKVSDSDVKFVRVHRSNILADILMVKDVEDFGKKERAMKVIGERGGAFIYLDTGNGHAEAGEKMDFRDYGIGAQIIRLLGYRRIIPITSKPLNYKGIEGFGITIEGFELI